MLSMAWLVLFALPSAAVEDEVELPESSDLLQFPFYIREPFVGDLPEIKERKIILHEHVIENRLISNGFHILSGHHKNSEGKHSNRAPAYQTQALVAFKHADNQ